MTWLLDDPRLENSKEILDFALTLNFGLPPWLFLFILTALGVWSLWYHREAAKEKTLGQRLSLSSLRWLTLGLMLLLLLQPHLDVDHMVEPKSQLAILVDQSQSMSLREKGASEAYFSTWAEALDLTPAHLERSDRQAMVQTLYHNESLGWGEFFEEDFSPKLFTYDDELGEHDIAQIDNLPKPSGESTQLGKALRQIQRRTQGMPLAAVVMFSDGAHNRGEDPLLAARALAEDGVRIFPVAIGDPDAKDVRIKALKLPDFIFVDDEVALQITLESQGCGGDELELEIALGLEKVIKHRCPSQDGVFTTSVTVKSSKLGVKNCQVKVLGLEGEHFLENNDMDLSVQVIEREIRVLLALEGPSWEFRYLKHMLDRDPRYDAKVFMRRGDVKRKQHDDQILDRFPFEHLHQDFDLLILNNLDASLFTADKMNIVRDFVSESGGSLMMLAATSGTPSSYAATPIGDMLPVEFDAVVESVEQDLEKSFTKPFQLKPTREGLHHPLTKLSPIVEENQSIWEKLPPQYWWYKGIVKAKRSATVLIEHDSERREGVAVPLMATQRFGKGEVVFLGINSIWRWRDRVGNRYTQRFWGQAVQYLGLPHLLGYVDTVQISTVGREFELGTPIDVDLRVMDEDFEPLDEKQVTLLAKEKLSGEVLTLPVSSAGANGGRYRGQIHLKEGEWELTVQGREDAVQHPIRVVRPQYEQQNPAMNLKLLEQMAAISGGAVMKPESLASLPELLQQRQEWIRVADSIEIWDSTLLFLLFLAFACGEWALRKKWDLP
jgi:uncharacterized membrane protein